jgi:hypothetical protein
MDPSRASVILFITTYNVFAFFVFVSVYSQLSLLLGILMLIGKIIIKILFQTMQIILILPLQGEKWDWGRTSKQDR